MIAMFCACSGGKDSLLEQAAQCVETAPAKALACLDSIEEPGRLGKDGLAEYYFLRWHATFLRDGHLGNSLPVPEVAAYWESKKEYRKAAWAWLYCSISQKHLAEQGEAALSLDKARQLASELQDSLLAFYVHYHQGRLLFHNRAFPEGVEAFRQAAESCPRQATPEIAPYWVKVAECHLYTGNYKGAGQAYQKVKACMEKGQGSPGVIHGIFRSVRDIRDKQVQEGLLEDWRDYFKEDAYAVACSRLVEAEAFLRHSQPDSARLYLEKIERTLPPHAPELSLPFYKLQGRYYFQCGKYEQAARVYRRYLHVRDSLQMSLANDRLERIVAGYNQARLEQQIRLLQYQRLGLILGITAVILASISVALWIARLKKRKEEKLAETERMMDTLQELHRRQDAQREHMKALLMKELEVSRQLTYLSSLEQPKQQSFLKAYDEMLGHIYGIQLNWDKFYHLVDCLFDGFHQKLTAHPQVFTEKDVQYLCLLQGGFRLDEIAFVMKVSPSAIHKRAAALQKRFGIGERQDLLPGIVAYLKNRG